MTKALLLAATAAILTGGAAQAHGYGYDRSNLPPPPYAGDYAADDDDDGGRGCRPERLTLVGANAGVTVLGLHVGASGRLRAGFEGGCRHERRHAPYPGYSARSYGYGEPRMEPRYGEGRRW